MILHLLQRWKGTRPRFMTLDENAYKIPVHEMDKVLERTKEGKMTVDHKGYGVDSADVIMSFWAYVNNCQSFVMVQAWGYLANGFVYVVYHLDAGNQ
jgi:hypothetical protein